MEPVPVPTREVQDFRSVGSPDFRSEKAIFAGTKKSNSVTCE
jgi:hypothetical protein